MRGLSLLVVSLVVTGPISLGQTSRSAQTYHNRATERYAKGDLDGAIADYSVAITFDPRMALAYYDR